MTQYFLTVPHDSADEPTMESMQEFDPADFAAVIAAVDAFNAELKESGAFVFAGGLNPPSTAKTVDASSGEPRVLDEPFVEAPSYVGGFWVIEAADDAAALEWTTKAAQALQGRIEVRALQEAPPEA
ncbi:YciI family protein [Agromyces sp. CCNWLW203]|uniref:YciI family protein n=1 Tax=Agromyces sp. CCNWLW203 TaxID=3112842 RepID=UPI002F964214